MMAEWCKSCMQPLGREQALGLCPECIENALDDRADLQRQLGEGQV
jgi:Zn finger protein HypA/HybF involved in hydrogenase expression